MLIGAQILGMILAIPIFYIFYKFWKLVIKAFVEKETEDTDFTTVDLISGFLSAITIAVGLILLDP